MLILPPACAGVAVYLLQLINHPLRHFNHELVVRDAGFQLRLGGGGKFLADDDIGIVFRFKDGRTCAAALADEFRRRDVE
jgi:hypothetical protein